MSYLLLTILTVLLGLVIAVAETRLDRKLVRHEVPEVDPLDTLPQDVAARWREITAQDRLS